VSARRISKADYEIVGWSAAVEGESRRCDNHANRGGANERNPRTALVISSFVGLALPHVGSMRRVRHPDAIVRGLGAQGSVSLACAVMDTVPPDVCAQAYANGMTASVGRSRARKTHPDTAT
jgi:hypothetical protein